jgi:tetratricopeptide (TPR) repeat protein
MNFLSPLYLAGAALIALPILLHLLRAHPTYPDLYNKVGLIHCDRGEFGKGSRAFRRAIELNPSYTEAYLNLTIALNSLGKIGEAFDVFSRAAGVARPGDHGGDPFITGKLANEHARLGDIYADLGRFGEAIEEYRRAVRLGPDFVDIGVKLAVAYREAGLLGKAASELKRIIRGRRTYIPARLQLGVTMFMGGKDDLARKAWQSVLAIDPGNAAAKVYLESLDSRAPRRSSPEGT